MKTGIVLTSLILLLGVSACSSSDNDETISLKRPKGWAKPVSMARSESWERDYYSPETPETEQKSALPKALNLIKKTVRKQVASLKKSTKRLAHGTKNTSVSKIR